MVEALHRHSLIGGSSVDHGRAKHGSQDLRLAVDSIKGEGRPVLCPHVLIEVKAETA
jgi:hypothetical protein